MREVICDVKTPDVICFRYEFVEGAPIFKIKVCLKTAFQTLINVDEYEPPRAYQSRFPLNEKKAEDILWLCNKLAIPTKYHGMWKTRYLSHFIKSK